GAGMVQFAGGTVNEGGVYNVTGGTLVTGGIAQFTGPVISVGPLGIAAGAANFSTGAIITVPSGDLQGTRALSGSHTVHVIGPLMWKGGTMSGSGKTVANAGMDLSGGAKTLSARTLTLAGGTATMSGGASRINMLSGAVFTNDATFEATNDAGQTSQGFTGVGTFNNSGTFRKTIGNTGETGISAAFNNTRSVEIVSSRLR